MSQSTSTRFPQGSTLSSFSLPSSSAFLSPDTIEEEDSAALGDAVNFVDRLEKVRKAIERIEKIAPDKRSSIDNDFLVLYKKELPEYYRRAVGEVWENLGPLIGQHKGLVAAYKADFPEQICGFDI